MSTWTLRPAALDHPDALVLIAEVQAEYERRYGGSGGDRAPLHPEQFVPPRGRFFVGYRGSRAVAMGGWRRGGPGGPDDAEIKRMYVREDMRGRGLARELLARLEDTARQDGVRRMVLATGTAQPEAIALYTSSGYTPIEPFGYYAHSPDGVHLARVLVPGPVPRPPVIR